MQEQTQIEKQKFKLPKSLTTVTTASKILALIMFVVLPFIGFYLGMKYQKLKDSTKINELNENINLIQKNNRENEPKPPSEKRVAQFTIDEINTSDWQSYINNELGFEFLYPQNWLLKTVSESYEGLILHIELSEKGQKYYAEGSEIDSPIDIVIEDNKDKQIDQIAEDYKKNLYGGTLEVTTIDNKKAYVLNNYLHRVFFTVRNNEVYSFSRINFGYEEANKPNDEAMSGIISSFKFTEKSK